MRTKFKQWGAVLFVFGLASLVLPFVGIQLRIFNLFGEGQRAAGLFAICLGTVLWVLGTRWEKGRLTPASAGTAPASSAPPPIATRSAENVSSGATTCTSCGAKIAPGDRFCTECGTPVPAIPVTASPVAAAPVAATAPPRKRRTGFKVLLVLFLLLAVGAAWFFFGPSKAYKPPMRSEPAIPERLAGTLTEFPVDTAGTNRLTPGNVVSQVFSPPTQGGTPTAPPLGPSTSPGLQTRPETIPPGVDTNAIPQVATAMTSCTYRIDPQSPPVHVHVIQAGSGAANLPVQMAQDVARTSGGEMQGASVQSPQGVTYDGFTIRTAAMLVYVLLNQAAGNVVLLYSPQAEGFPAVQRLASSVGNGRGLRDYPDVVDTYAALPATAPPGYSMTQMRNFGGDELRNVLTKTEGQTSETGAELQKVVEAVRVLIPERGTMAVYDNGQNQEKGVIIGRYASTRKASTAWRTLSWTLGLGMEKNDSLGTKALVTSDDESRIMLFHKGPFVCMVKIPAGSSEQELVDLAKSVQL